MKRYFIHILTAMLGVTMFSCSKDASSIFSDNTMGHVSDEYQIYTDTGLTYNVLEGREKLDGIGYGTRVMASCIVTECTDEEKEVFNVNLQSISVPLMSAPLEVSGYDASAWPDAIDAYMAWISGDYLNVSCMWVALAGSSVEHSTALVHEETARDTVFFRLVHDGKGEGYYIDTTETSTLEVANGMATFPIQKYIPAEGNVTIKLSWMWHKTSGYVILPQTEMYEACYSFTAASAEPSTKATISPLTTLEP